MKLHGSGHIKSRGNFLNLTCLFYDEAMATKTEDWIFQCDFILNYLQDVSCRINLLFESVFIS